jgi:pimeloyl-ACP methyl ester carboxylesterase
MGCPCGPEGFLWQTPDSVAKNFAQDVPAWRARPNWLVAANDRMIPPEAQRGLAARMRARVLALPSSHNPMLSRPAEVAAVMVEAAKSVRRQSPHSRHRGLRWLARLPRLRQRRPRRPG